MTRRFELSADFPGCDRDHNPLPQGGEVTRSEGPRDGGVTADHRRRLPDRGHRARRGRQWRLGPLGNRCRCLSGSLEGNLHKTDSCIRRDRRGVASAGGIDFCLWRTTDTRDDPKDVGTSMESGRQLWPAGRGLLTQPGHWHTRSPSPLRGGITPEPRSQWRSTCGANMPPSEASASRSCCGPRVGQPLFIPANNWRRRARPLASGQPSIILPT